MRDKAHLRMVYPDQKIAELVAENKKLRDCLENLLFFGTGDEGAVSYACELVGWESPRQEDEEP